MSGGAETTHPRLLDVVLRSLSKAELEGNVFILILVVVVERSTLIIFTEMATAAEEVVSLAGDARVVLEDVAELSTGAERVSLPSR